MREGGLGRGAGRERARGGELGRDLDQRTRIVGAPVDIEQPAQRRDVSRIEIRGAEEHVIGAIDIAEVDEHGLAEPVQPLGALRRGRGERDELVEVSASRSASRRA